MTQSISSTDFPLIIELGNLMTLSKNANVCQNGHKKIDPRSILIRIFLPKGYFSTPRCD
jgi:hypothetical protein